MGDFLLSRIGEEKRIDCLVSRVVVTYTIGFIWGLGLSNFRSKISP